MTRTYDAIVVGARCAGAPTAMLLARKGYRVLLVDRAAFPSDTVSTHLIHAPGVEALKRWGLLERVVATGCPPIETYAFDFGPFTITGHPGTAEAPSAYAPRRIRLDKILIDAAAEAGAEVREEFVVDELRFEDGAVIGLRGRDRLHQPVTENARVVIGADGLRSVVARMVAPEQYHQKPPILAGYYTYFSGLPMAGRFETYILPQRGAAAWPTNDGLTLVIAGWPYAQMKANRDDIEGNVMRALDLAPAFAERVRAAAREAPFAGMAVPNYFRKPYGPGWALVGDAGYNKDFITAQGIQDAFRDAELCSTALDESFGGERHFDVAMADYRAKRDAWCLPIYELTTEFATLEPPPPHLQQLLAAIRGNQPAMDGFASTVAGATSPAAYFSDANVSRMLGETVPAGSAG